MKLLKESENKKQVGLPSRILRRIKKLIPNREESWAYGAPHEYWDARYRDKVHGGTSGPGSLGENREWKWQIISRFVDVTKKRVLDVGCGDLSFWEGRDCASYIGVDFSPTIVKRNRESKPNWKFVHGDASENHDLSGDVLFCFDMLFHIMSDDVFTKILRNLTRWTKEWLFVYTWHKSMFGDSPTDGLYQYYRPLLSSLNDLAPLQLVEAIQQDEFGTLYIFKKSDQ